MSLYHQLETVDIPTISGGITLEPVQPELELDFSKQQFLDYSTPYESEPKSFPPVDSLPDTGNAQSVAERLYGSPTTSIGRRTIPDDSE